MHMFNIILIGFAVLSIIVVTFFFAKADGDDDAAFGTALFLGGVTVILAIISGLNAVEHNRCRIAADNIESSTFDYSWVAGCFVEVDGVMVPLDNYRIID